MVLFKKKMSIIFSWMNCRKMSMIDMPLDEIVKMNRKKGLWTSKNRVREGLRYGEAQNEMHSFNKFSSMRKGYGQPRVSTIYVK
jgi:spore coat polysaccharide biosynthesis predicted glycosyltransferase SpsG